MALWAWESRGVGDLPSVDPIVLRSMQSVASGPLISFQLLEHVPEATVSSLDVVSGLGIGPSNFFRTMEVNSIRLLLQPPVKQLPYGLCTDRGEEPLSRRIHGRSSSLKPGQACTFQMKQSTPSALQMYCSHFEKKTPGIHQ